MYFSSWLVHLDNCDISFSRRCASWSSSATAFDTTYSKNLETALQIILFPFRKAFGFTSCSKHAEKIEAFYQDQALNYDNFRESFLHARCPMLSCLPLKASANLVWVDIGGGTARNLEYLKPNTLKAMFKKIFIVDICSSLLEVAKKRVKSAGLSNVEFVCIDFTEEEKLKHLPEFGTVDICTFSYSLSMIPKKDAALQNARRLLKGDGQGILGIADFFERSGREHQLQYPLQALRWLERKAHQAWFSFDSVNILTDDALSCAEEKEKIFEEYFRGSTPLLPFLRPVHGFLLYKST